MLDVDRFKVINSDLGHDAGDELLIQLAERLRECVEPTAILARQGGDEFAILLPTAHAHRSRELAQRILDQMNQPFILRDQIIYLSMSIGIALSMPATRRFSSLLTEADIAMYSAKTKGGGIRIYEPSLSPAMRDRLVLETDLRVALVTGKLTLYYQPIVEVATSTIIGVEALIRWPHPTRGLLIPSHFLGVAEDAGLLGILDRWVLRQAIAQLAEWWHNGHQIAISINLTDHSLRDPELIFDIEDLITEYDVPADAIIIEITEYTALRDMATTNEVLNGLKQLGVRIALDDFGTGYASLTNLRNLPVEILKLDRTFSAGIGTKAEDEAVVQALLQLGQGLSLTVVVEGVEQPVQQAWLERAGCQLIQGYLLGRPMPPEEAQVLFGTHPITETENDNDVAAGIAETG
ncbi:MAG: bifunctional diguanylate cyclase/phosphodiesterase [Chloroflexaceae bacterium]|nr:bifunctional diguanylate cyclase/phosphodiesterase [Chloroflexaceae bacterium]